MSRNLLSTKCVHCEHKVELLEEPHPITKEEAGRYFDEYEGMIVAKAICPMCLAEYLAWIDETERVKIRIDRKANYGEVLDLSYYSTFNDEPDYTDLPKYDVQVIKTWHRVAKIR